MGKIPRDQNVKRYNEFDHYGYLCKDKVYQEMVEEFEITKITREELLQDYLCEWLFSYRSWVLRTI